MCHVRCTVAIGRSWDSLLDGYCSTVQIGHSWDSLELNGAACAIICHSARGRYNIFTSGWVAPYFSLGSARVVQLNVVQSTQCRAVKPTGATRFGALAST